MAMVLEFSKTLGSKTTKSHQHHSYFYVSDTFPRTQEHSCYWKPPKIVHSCGVNRLSSAVVNWLSLTDHKFPKDWFSTLPNVLGSQDHLAVKLYNPIWEPSTAIAGVEKKPQYISKLSSSQPIKKKDEKEGDSCFVCRQQQSSQWDKPCIKRNLLKIPPFTHKLYLVSPVSRYIFEFLRHWVLGGRRMLRYYVMS